MYTVLYDAIHAPYKSVFSGDVKVSSEDIFLTSLKNDNTSNNVVLSVTQLLKQLLKETNIIYGVKLVGEKLHYELYVYARPNLLHITPSKVLEELKKVLPVTIDYEKELDILYECFSIDFTKDIINNELCSIHLYKMEDVASHMCSYLYTNFKSSIENRYKIYFLPTHQAELEHILTHSTLFSCKNVTYDMIIPIELQKCFCVCHAIKPTMEGVYISRITLQQFIYFLTHFNYPQDILTYVTDNSNHLDYLLYDIAFDYIIKDDKVIILQTAFNGCI